MFHDGDAVAGVAVLARRAAARVEQDVQVVVDAHQMRDFMPETRPSRTMSFPPSPKTTTWPAPDGAVITSSPGVPVSTRSPNMRTPSWTFTTLSPRR
ncbi:hypothetical protein [Azospirillum sp. Marseille-Q6669]